MPKLSKRLTAVHAMITQQYDHIWDCCCDHGDLGSALLQSQPHSMIHFVDVVDPIIQTLNDKLSAQYPDSSRWQTHCSDLNHLKLDNQSAKHLIIIAGVGGDLTAELVRSLLKQNAGVYIEFILCPIRHHFRLRQELRAQSLRLIDEMLIKERNFYYEIMHIGSDGEEIQSCGSKMWDLQQQDHLNYLAQKLQHYGQALRSDPAANTEAFKAYQQIKTHY